MPSDITLVVIAGVSTRYAPCMCSTKAPRHSTPRFTSPGLCNDMRLNYSTYSRTTLLAQLRLLPSTPRLTTKGYHAILRAILPTTSYDIDHRQPKTHTSYSLQSPTPNGPSSREPLPSQWTTKRHAKATHRPHSPPPQTSTNNSISSPIPPSPPSRPLPRNIPAYLSAHPPTLPSTSPRSIPTGPPSPKTCEITIPPPRPAPLATRPSHRPPYKT